MIVISMIEFETERTDGHRYAYQFRASKAYNKNSGTDFLYWACQIIPWLIENFGEYEVDKSVKRWAPYFKANHSIDDHFTVYFRDEEDALAFKMRWT